MEGRYLFQVEPEAHANNLRHLRSFLSFVESIITQLQSHKTHVDDLCCTVTSIYLFCVLVSKEVFTNVEFFWAGVYEASYFKLQCTAKIGSVIPTSFRKFCNSFAKMCNCVVQVGHIT